MTRFDRGRSELEVHGEGESEEAARRELEAIYREAVGPLPDVPPMDAADDVVFAGPGDILCSPEDPADQAVVLLRDGDRLYVAPVAPRARAAGPLELDVPEADQHEAMRLLCGAGGWIAIADAARLDLVASIDDGQLCEARRRVILRSALDPASASPETIGGRLPPDTPESPQQAREARPLAARAPMGIAIDGETGPLSLWVAAQLDADRGIASLATRWAGTSVGGDLLAAARVAPGGALHEAALLDGILDGVERALAGIVSVPSTSFDDVWIILEALEETAAMVAVSTPAMGDRFAAGIAAIVSSSESPLVHGGLAWSVNELLERGPASATLGLRVARALLADPPPLVCDVLYILTTLRRPLADALALSGMLDALRARAAAGRARVAESAAVARKLDAAIHAARGGVLELDAVLAPIASLLTKIHDGVRAPREGMLAMAAIKRPLSQLGRAIQHLPECEAIFDGVCEAFLGPLAERGAGSAFLVVESLEALRDRFPRETSAMMADRLPRVQLDVAYGLGVCIVEGIEEELGADPARRPPRFAVRDDPGGARQCEYEDGLPPSAFGDFGRRSLRAAEAYEDVAGVWRWCHERLRAP